MGPAATTLISLYFTWFDASENGHIMSPYSAASSHEDVHHAEDHVCVFHHTKSTRDGILGFGFIL
jgi:hypothetical protein